MSYFAVPCQKHAVSNVEAVSMPTLLKSTYTIDYTAPKQRFRQQLKESIALSLPPDYLSEETGRRILPTTFEDMYKNCISASIGDKLELKFQDDTPLWKKRGREAILRNFLHPLPDRRKFVQMQIWNLCRHPH